MDYSFEAKMAESQLAEKSALDIINKQLGSSFVSVVGSKLDLENCVDFTDGETNIAWRHLSDKYGYEPTMKITQMTNGKSQSNEFHKMVGGKSKANYHLYTFHSGNPAIITAWILVDSEKLAKYLNFYSGIGLEGRKNFGDQYYTFLKIRPIFLKQVGAIVKQNGCKSTPSYGNPKFSGDIYESLFWKEQLEIHFSTLLEQAIRL